jgi:hypothetical protein
MAKCSVEEPKTFFSALAPWSRKTDLWLRHRIVLKDILKITFFVLSYRMKIVTIYKNFFSRHDFFYNISSCLW